MESPSDDTNRSSLQQDELQFHDKHSQFLKLPPELRNQIYSMVFARCVIQRNNPFSSTGGRIRIWSYERGAAIPDPTALLRVCNQIYHEARTIFWERCVYELGIASPASPSRDTGLYGTYVRQWQRLSIRTVVIKPASWSSQHQWSELTLIPNLEKVFFISEVNDNHGEREFVDVLTRLEHFFGEEAYSPTFFEVIDPRKLYEGDFYESVLW